MVSSTIILPNEKKSIQARWPRGLRCWFKAPVNLVAWVWVQLLSFCRHIYTKNCFLYIEPLQMVSPTIIHVIDVKTYRRDCRVVWNAGLRHQALWLRGLSPTPFILLTFLYKVLFPLFWSPAHGIFYHHPGYWPQKIETGWPSGLGRWLKATVTSVA